MIGKTWNQPKDINSIDALLARLGDRSIVLVGLMGCGKSSRRRRLASRLGLSFVDADEEIERGRGQIDRGNFR